MILCLTPWTIRNYKLFDRFIPLTYGTGNPLLLGTYQGVGYPSDENLDYEKNVVDKMPKDMKYYLENPEEKPYLTKYYSLEYDGLKAKYRMNEWWKNDKISMIKSYLISKPYILVKDTFYWKNILGLSVNSIIIVRNIDIILFVLSSLIIKFIILTLQAAFHMKKNLIIILLFKPIGICLEIIHAMNQLL